MQLILNRLGVSHSYDSMDQFRRRLCRKRKDNPKSAMAELKDHEMSVFSIDNLDQANKNGILVGGKAEFGMPVTAIQDVFCNSGLQVPITMGMYERYFMKHMSIGNASQFINSFVACEQDVVIDTHVQLFIGLMYHHQSQITSTDPKRAVSVSKLVSSMFEGFRTKCDIKYVDVVNQNAEEAGAIHKR